MRYGAFILAVTLLVSSGSIVGRTQAAGCSSNTHHKDPKVDLEACNTVLEQTDLSEQKRVAALKTRALALVRLQRFDAAIKDYEHVLLLAPKDSESHVRLGWIAYGNLELERALQFARKALELDPRNALAFNLIGDVAWRQNDLTSALKAYDRAIAILPDNPLVRFSRLKFFDATANDREVLAESEAILALPARTLDIPQAVGTFGTFVSYREAASLHRALAFSKMARYEEADKAFDELIVRTPSALTFTRRASYRLFRELPLDLVQSDIDRAMALDPNYWGAHEQQARLHEYTRKFSEAVTSYTRAIELNPTSGQLRWRRAVLIRELGRLEEAMSEALAAIEADPWFMMNKAHDFAERGYLYAHRDTTWKAAIRDAVTACMLDEGCG